MRYIAPSVSHFPRTPHRLLSRLCTCSRACCFLLIIALGLCVETLAQPPSPKPIRDSKGKDFWIAFPRNFHGGGIDLYDNIHIFVTCERATRGKIEYTVGGRAFTQDFAITNPEEVYEFVKPYGGLEVQEGSANNTTFHVTSDQEVTVYGLSVANRTSDAFLAFPTDVLGKNHIIASYNNSIPPLAGNNGTPPTTSQFVVAAPENNTTVMVTPSAPTNFGNAPFSFTLQRGQAMLIVAQIASRSAFDLTGTRLLSSKPVVVYGSHERANIPFEITTSRDCLIEQMLPVEAWGTSALVAPYPRPNSGSVDLGCDFVRVIAGYDGTQISYNGNIVGTLNAGGFLQIPMSGAAHIVGSQQIMVAGYKCSSGTGSSLGDPFLAVIPPVEQFLTRYRFVCVQGLQTAQTNVGNSTNTVPAFQEHYVSVVAPTTKATTVVLDGSRLSLSQFTRIGNTAYSFANVRVGAGTHNIAADTTFGITVMGYGQANSYGYVGGQRFETDLRAPRIVTTQGCLRIDGRIFDSADVDSKIYWYEAPQSDQKNVRLRFEQLPSPADSLVFTADVINPYEDGEFTLTTLDSLELRTTQRLKVGGFTVHADSSIRTARVITTTATLATGREYCFRVNLQNYGSTTQTITGVSFASATRSPQSGAERNFYANTMPPATTLIETRSQQSVGYCFRAERDGLYEDTLFIDNGCVRRPILAIRFDAGRDVLPPQVQSATDPCNRLVTFSVRDNRRYDAGVAEILVLQNMTQNCDVRITRSATSSTVQVAVSVINPRLDAFYHLVVQDSVGNEQVLTDTIQGFSLRFLSAADTSVARFVSAVAPTPETRIATYQFLPLSVQAVTCGTLIVRNEGVLPFTLDKLMLANNTRFSIPQHQIPFIIPPQSARTLTACFNPDIETAYYDTISVSKFCITERIVFEGRGMLGSTEAPTRCKVDVRLTALPSTVLPSLAVSTIALSHFPDPAHGTVTVRAELSEPHAMTVKLYSMMGMLVASVPESRFQSGVWDMTIDISSLEPGVYICEARSDKERNTQIVRVVR